jgi:plastocyanin
MEPTMKTSSVKISIFLTVIFLLTSATVTFAGTLIGDVTYRGTPPAPKLLKVTTDAFCMSHAKELLSESLIVSKAGGIQNVVISVLKVSGKFDPLKEDVLIDQVNCVYMPHVLPVLAGTTIKIRSSDLTLHNVHVHAKKNEAVNWAMPIKDMALPYKAEAAEVVRFTCDVHNWMNAYVVILDNPYFAVTGVKDSDGQPISAEAFRASQSKGAYRIENIPAGTYRVQVWHETLGIARKQSDVSETGEVHLHLTSDDFVKTDAKK